MVLAAVAVAASSLVGAGTAVAQETTLQLEYRCAYPLIGTKDIKATIKADIPAELKVGEFMPVFDVAAVTEIGADTTEGLYTMNAKTLEGSALAKVSVAGPGEFGVFSANTTVNLIKKEIPESGPFTIDAAGKSPRRFSFEEPGWGRINVGNLDLTVTPRDKDGNPTALGTFKVACVQKPNQKNVLHEFYVSDGNPAPPKPAPENLPIQPGVEPKTTSYPRHVHSSSLTYTCRYPVIGVHNITVNARLENYPAAVQTGYYTPRIAIDSVNMTDEETSEGLLLLDPPAATLEGQALAWATLTAPEVTGGPLAVRVKMPLPKSTVAPLPPKPTVIEAAGSAPALTFAKEGEAEVRIGNLDVTMTPRTASGGLTPMGTIKTTCTQLPGQDNLLARINILAEPDTTPPSTPGAPSVTGTADTSIGLRWGAATDNVGVSGYDIFNGAIKVAGTYGPGTSTAVQGLRHNNDYTFTIKARDGSGNISPAASPPVSARTTEGLDTEPPTIPTRPAGTGKTLTSLSLAWPASKDTYGVTGYEVYKNGALALRVSGTRATVTGLRPGTSYTLRVKARDKAGNFSALSDPLVMRTNPDTKAPTTPGKPRITGKTPRTVSLAWPASKDNVGVAGYNVLRNGRLVLRVTGTRAVLTDLAPGTGYNFKVRARDASGNLSKFSPVVTARTRFAAALTSTSGQVRENPFDLFLDLIAGQGGDTGLTLVPEP